MRAIGALCKLKLLPLFHSAIFSNMLRCYMHARLRSLADNFKVRVRPYQIFVTEVRIT